MSDNSRNTDDQRCSQRQRDSTNRDASIKVYAWARPAASNDWHRVLKFRNKDWKKHTVLLDPEDETPSRLLTLLKRLGCPLPTGSQDQRKLVDKILKADPKRRMLLVYRFGWHSNQFQLGTKTVGDGLEPI